MLRRIAFWLLVLFAFAVPWQYSLYFGSGFGSIARIFSIAAMVLGCIGVVVEGALRRPTAAHLACVAYFLFCCASAYWAIEPVDNAIELRAYLQVMWAVWLIWECVDSERDLVILMWAVIAGGIVLSGLTCLDFITTGGAIVKGQRFAAEGFNPNEVARILAWEIPLAAGLFRRSRRWVLRVLALLFVPIALIGVGLSGSRGGSVATVVALIAYVYIAAGGAQGLRKVRIVNLLIVSAAIVTGVAIAIQFVPSADLNRIASAPEAIAAGNLSDRNIVWSTAWGAFREHPIVGFGLGGFVAAVGLAPNLTAHNVTVGLLIEVGLLGTALFFVAYLLILYRSLISRGWHKSCFLAAFLIWSINSLVGTLLGSRETWLLFGLMLAASRLSIFPEISGPELAEARSAPNFSNRTGHLSPEQCR